MGGSASSVADALEAFGVVRAIFGDFTGVRFRAALFAAVGLGEGFDGCVGDDGMVAVEICETIWMAL